MDFKLGSKLRKILESDLFELLDKDIIIKLNIKCPNNGVSSVDFRFEKHPKLCLPCGILGKS